MTIFRLLAAVACVAVAACDSSSSPPSTPVTVQADPASNTLTAAESAAGDVSGQWFCAMTEFIYGNYVAYWNEAYSLEFHPDRTLAATGIVTNSGTWWYTEEGVTIQWSSGGVAEYQANVSNRGGIADDNTHCLRELPPVDGDGSANADDIPTYDCGSGYVVGFAADGSLIRNGSVTGRWRTYLGNGIGEPTPDAAFGFTYVEFNDTLFTVIDDTLLQEFGEWSCFSVSREGPLLPLLAPMP
jgi:hypothetical protein